VYNAEAENRQPKSTIADNAKRPISTAYRHKALDPHYHTGRVPTTGA